MNQQRWLGPTMVIWQVMVLTHDKVLLAEVPYLRWNLKENTKPSQELENWNLVQGGTQPQIGLEQSVGRKIYAIPSGAFWGTANDALWGVNGHLP